MSQFDTPKLPEVKFNKNGYEIRTQILDMAKGLISEEYHSKFQGWEISAAKDEKTGQIVMKLLAWERKCTRRLNVITTGQLRLRSRTTGQLR